MVSFEKKVLNYIYEHELVEKGDRLLIACSGGIDSMGLLHLFHENARKLEVEISVAHVDHMLRGDTSAEDRQFVEDFCKERNIPVFSTAVAISEILELEGGNSQAICRRERYAYFKDIMEMEAFTKLVTAHHADDQLESMLMSLTKTGSLIGMKGMYPKRKFQVGYIIRPFLSVTKEEIKEYLNEKNGSYREDSSNAKDSYTRNRFRHHVIPLLKKENENVPMNAVKLSEYIQQDDEFLTDLAYEKYKEIVEYGEHEVKLNVAAFTNEPVALQRRVILILLNYLYKDFYHVNSDILLKSILQLCNSEKGSGILYLPDQYIVNRRYEEALFLKGDHILYDNNLDERQLLFNEWYELKNGVRVYIGDVSHETKLNELGKSMQYYFSSKNFFAPFKIRPRKSGDRIALKGMAESKRLSRLFIDEKIPLTERDSWPILVDANEEVLCVLGIRTNKNLSKNKRPQDDIKIVIEYNNV